MELRWTRRNGLIFASCCLAPTLQYLCLFVLLVSSLLRARLSCDHCLSAAGTPRGSKGRRGSPSLVVPSGVREENPSRVDSGSPEGPLLHLPGALTRQHFVREGVPGSLGSMCLFHTCFCSKQSSPRAADCPPETRSLTKPEAYLWARLAGFTYLCSSALITSVWPGPAFVWLLGI